MIKLFQNGVLLDKEKIPLLTTVLGSTQITLLDVEDWYSNIFAASVHVLGPIRCVFIPLSYDQG